MSVNNKIINSFLMILKIIVTFFVIIIVSIIFVQRVSNNKVTLGGYSIFTVVSGSMMPEYEIGDMIIAKKVEYSDINVGDDVVYLGNKGNFSDRIVTHRVIKIDQSLDKDNIYTQGIANQEADPAISYTQIYGKVVYKTVILSLLSHIMNSTYGFYFVIFIPFSVMIFLEILGIIKDKKASNKTGE